jgi:Kef-type K+ transport system membrane component KefB
MLSFAPWTSSLVSSLRSVPFRNRPGARYAALLLAAGVLWLLIRAQGERLLAPALPLVESGRVAVGMAAGMTAAGTAAPQTVHNVLLHVLLSLLVVILVSRALGALFRHLQQPPVIGEVLAGLALGPSLLGRVAPQAQAVLLPSAIAPQLGIIAQLGILLFMFLIGLELDTRLLRKHSRTTLAISHASMVVPFLAGATLALWLYPVLSSRDVGFTAFSLFLAASMSVTAFPVLARVLGDRGMQRSDLGVVALACAAVDDVTAWCALALIIGVVRADTGGALLTLVLTLAYVFAMIRGLRPIVRRVTEREGLRKRSSQGATAAALVGLFASALVTEAIGVHALFGAFLFGAIIPHDSLLARDLNRRLRDLIVVLFLPAFFAYTGLRLELGLLETRLDVLYCLVIIVVACAGKVGGTALAARYTGMPWRQASALGVLMNTRGLMELIVLHVGLDLGVISPRAFTMLVIMAVVTTLLTSPLLALLRPSSALAPNLVSARSV